MKRVVDFVRDPQFEKEHEFDPSIDYVALWDEFMSLVKAKDQEAVKRFIIEKIDEGPISLYVKVAYQRDLRAGKIVVDDLSSWKVSTP